MANPLCDLCGCATVQPVVTIGSPRALRSDRVVLQGHLSKLGCVRCGLVRDASDGLVVGPDQYRTDYDVSVADHHFYTADGPRSRSALLADWIHELVRRIGASDRFASVLEVGAGAGFVLSELGTRLPRLRRVGYELNAAAAAAAEARGVEMLHGSLDAVPDGAFDFVYAVAVLEHVPSPTEFLAGLRRVVRDDGWVVLIQPTQDVESYDLFFVDHLHHFGTAHLAAYAEKCGFREHHQSVGYACMPNFSGHLWQAGVPRADWAWSGPPAPLRCLAAADRLVGDFRRLDAELGALAAAGRRCGVFGLHEVFALTRAYTSIASHRVVCGLDDDPGKAEYRQYPFPVDVPERAPAYGCERVLLTMNRMYYPLVTERIERLGMTAYPVLS